MMTIIRLTIITQNQKSKDKAERLSDLICSTIGVDLNPIIEKYYKFDDSFKIIFEFAYSTLNDSDKIHGLIELSDRICSPWLLYYNRDVDSIELIYNKTDSSKFRKNEYNVINWALLQMENE